MDTATIQTIRHDFNSASDLVFQLLGQIEIDVQNVRRASRESYDSFKSKAEQTWQDWPQIREEFRAALNNLPKEIRRRDFVKDMIHEVEQFEAAAKSYFSDVSWPTVQSFKNSCAPSVQNFYDQMQAVSVSLHELKNNQIMQKFLRGETVLASRSNIQWARKIGHMMLGLVFLYLFRFSGLSQSIVYTIFAAFMVWGFSLEIARHFNPRVNAWVCKAFKPVMREREKQKINSAIYYMAAMSLVYFFCPLDVASVTMLYIAVGDPVAGVVGVFYGKHKISEHTSWEGLLANVGICALLSYLMARFFFVDFHLHSTTLVIFALAGGVISAIAESSFKFLDDNLTIPLISAPLVWAVLAFLG